MCVCSCPAGEVEAGGVAVELVLAEVDLPQRPPDAPREVAPADAVILYYIILYYIILYYIMFLARPPISYIISRRFHISYRAHNISYIISRKQI